MLYKPYLNTKKIQLLLFLLLIATSNFAQTGIGRTKPRGALDINKPDGSNTSGLVLPRINNINLVVNPQGTPIIPGTIIYDAELDCLRYFSAKTNSWSDCLQIRIAPPVQPDLASTDCIGVLLNNITTSESTNLNNLPITIKRPITPFASRGFSQSCSISATGLNLGINGNQGILSYTFSREVSNLKVLMTGTDTGEKTTYVLKLKGEVVSGKIDLATNIGCSSGYTVNGTTITHTSREQSLGALYNIGGVWFDEIIITVAQNNTNGAIYSFCITNAK